MPVLLFTMSVLLLVYRMRRILCLLYVLVLLGEPIGLANASKGSHPPTGKAGTTTHAERNQREYVIAIFGDSFSDNGNDLRAAGVPDPRMYYKGRFSNGPNWVDYLKAAANKTQLKAHVQVFNYAYGFATACANKRLQKEAPFVKNLTAQTAAFLADVKLKIPTGKKTKLLVIQAIGTYDFLFPLLEAEQRGVFPSPKEISDLVLATVGCRLAAIQTLLKVPAIKDIAVLPIFPLHIGPMLTPEVRAQLQVLETTTGIATVAAVNALRSAVEATWATRKRPRSHVKLHTIGVTGDWMAAGVTEVRPPYTHTDVPCISAPPADAIALRPGVFPKCSNPAEYLWYDRAHLETRYHQWFATQGLIPQLQALKLLPHGL